MPSGFLSIVRKYAMFCHSSRYSLRRGLQFPGSMVTEQKWRAPSCTSMSSFTSTSSLISSWAALSLCERPFAALCLVPGICWTSKSNSLIYANYRVTRAPGRSAAGMLSWVTKVLASNSMMNWMPYSQNCVFFSTFSRPWHFLFPALYFCSTSLHTLLSYHTGYHHPVSGLICISTAPHPSRDTSWSTMSIIFPPPIL